MKTFPISFFFRFPNVELPLRVVPQTLTRDFEFIIQKRTSETKTLVTVGTSRTWDKFFNYFYGMSRYAGINNGPLDTAAAAVQVVSLSEKRAIYQNSSRH